MLWNKIDKLPVVCNNVSAFNKSLARTYPLNKGVIEAVFPLPFNNCRFVFTATCCKIKENGELVPTTKKIDLLYDTGPN